MVKSGVLLVHCAAILAILFVLIQQLRRLSTQLSLADLGEILKLDVLYSWSALMVLCSGIMLWLLGDAPAGNSLTNSWFVVKLCLMAFVALLSVYPSMVFLGLKTGPLKSRLEISRYVFVVKFGELILFVAALGAALFV